MGSRPGPADAGANQLQPLTTGARTRQEPKTSEPAAQYEKASAAHLQAARRKMVTEYNSFGDDATGAAEREKLTHARACLTVLSSISILCSIGIICIIDMLVVFQPLTRNVNLPKLPSASKEVASARHERLGVDESHARSKLSGMSDIWQLSASEDEALHNITLTVPSPPLLSPLPLPPPPPSPPLPRPAKPPPPPSPLSPHRRWPKCNVLPIFRALSTGGGYEISQRQLILLAAPKAGATVTSRLAIALAGKTQAAVAYGGYPLRYAHARLPSHLFFPGSFFSKCRQIESWTCIHFLRNPMDRAVSSYLHTMKHDLFKYTVGRLGVMCGAGGASVQHCLHNASFFEFISTLQDVAATKGASLNPHWTPQFHPDISYSGVTLVPLESLPDGYECPLLAKTEGQLLAGREGNFSIPSLTNHYVLHTDSKPSTATAFLDFTTLSKMRARGQVPPYDDFYKDKGFCRHILTCLYAGDLDAYVKMCGQAHVRACPSLNAACQRELVRLRDVCGLPASKLGLNSSAH